MQLLPKTWNEKTYQEFVNYLLTLQDKKYKEFHSSLVTDCQYEMIGIRVPMMKNVAKEISKNSNIEEFLKVAQDHYYEEVMIQGLVIAYMKEERTFYQYFKKHVPKIDNWALCDTFCSSIKMVEKFPEKYFDEAIKMAQNKKEFTSRVGLVILLNHFVKKEYLDKIYALLNSIKSEKYYINMAEAWLVCELYIKYPKETMRFIQKNNLNKETQNKAISKIHDSFRVSKEEKEELKKYRK